MARKGRPRSAASRLKWAAATTLFAEPCSQTNTTVPTEGGSGEVVKEPRSSARHVIFISSS
jgi:hypothetical protein